MNGWIFSYGLLILSMVASLVTGCTLNRPADEASGDIGASAFQPPTAAMAQTETVIRVEPGVMSLNVGQSAVIEIWIDNVTDLYAVDIQLAFDPNVLQVIDADPSQDGIQVEPGDFLSADFVVDNEADNVTGDIFYAVTQIGSTPPANGSGLLARATLQAVAQGTSQLNFVLAQLVTITDGSPEEISVTPLPGQITVNPPTGQPTSTFTPTLIPGQPTPTFTPSPSPSPTFPPGTPTPSPTIIAITPTPPIPSATPTLAPSPTPTNTPVPLADVPVIFIPPGATYGFCYRVQPDETLTSIAYKFGIDPHFLNLANDLNPPGYVFQNQALFIPQTYGHGPNVYQVQFGDTMAKIAGDCHIKVEYLAQVNGVSVNERLTLNKGETVRLENGSTMVLTEDKIRIETLLIPVPPFAPPSRYPYPGSVSPPVSPPPCAEPPCRPVCSQPPCY